MPLKVFFGLVQLAFCCALIYLFGNNFVVLNLTVSVKCREMVADMSECSRQGAVGDLIFQLLFGGVYHFCGGFSVCKVRDLEPELVTQTFSFLVSFSNSLFPLLRSLSILIERLQTDFFVCFGRIFV